PSHFEFNADGRLWCKVYRQKSEELSAIPILECALFIIEKYKDNPASLKRDRIFPYVSNQQLNRGLKMIGEVCGINKYMSFHLARHTFATAVTLKNGVPIETVSKMLGHAKLATTLVYAEVDEEKIGIDMIKVEQKMETRKTPMSH
ncbi:MAG: site-specific integrase, partial [Bacteroidota bacterium]